MNTEQYSRPDHGQHLLQNDRQYSPRDDRRYSLRSEGRHSVQYEEQPPLQSGDQYSILPKTDHHWSQFAMLNAPDRPEDTGEEMEDTMRYASNE